jgi:hypothetical protein
MASLRTHPARFVVDRREAAGDRGQAKILIRVLSGISLLVVKYEGTVLLGETGCQSRVNTM